MYFIIHTEDKATKARVDKHVVYNIEWLKEHFNTERKLYEKKGKWIWNKRTGEYECSECGCNPVYEGTTPDDSEIDKYRYCRWCGAPMEVEG